MQERYSQVIESGLLWYLGSVSPQQVKLVPQELQSLIQLRNWLAAYLVPGQPLPEVVRDDRVCGKCFQKSVCALSHKVTPHAAHSLLYVLTPCLALCICVAWLSAICL